MQSSTRTAPDWIKVSEAAAEIGIHPRTLKNMIRDGRVRVRTMQFDQATRIHRKDWEAEVASRVTVPASA
jgi:predicted DNA-binding protein (UPF0251 family)